MKPTATHTQKAQNVRRSLDHHTPATTVQRSLEQVLRSTGQPLPSDLRADMETRLGHNFSQVRVHADGPAADSARIVNALAYTVGDHIVFGQSGFSPLRPRDRHLLGHELAHVVQQRSHGGAEGQVILLDADPTGPLEQEANHAAAAAIGWGNPVGFSSANGQRVQRQVAVPDIGRPVRLSGMTDRQLQDRYDQIVDHFTGATQSTIGDDQLVAEAGQIGVILTSRTGRTFDVTEIQQMRKFFEANAKAAKPKSCIVTLNQGVKLLLSQPKQKTAGSVDETAARLQQSGHAGAERRIDFLDARGRKTTGTLSPVRLRESVFDAVVALAGGDRGWSAFVMSLMDGYHSVTLSLDNTDPSHPRIFWSDQWSSKGGFKEYTRAALDKEIEDLTHQWWEEEAAGIGESAKKTHRAVRMNTLVRLYRLIGTPHHVGPAPEPRARLGPPVFPPG